MRSRFSEAGRSRKAVTGVAPPTFKNEIPIGENSESRDLKCRDNVRRMRQIALFKEKVIREFGGSTLKGKRKIQRPLATKGTNHLVLKATSSHLLLRNQDKTNDILYRYAKRFGVRIYSLAVQADHIHLKFRAGSRNQYRAWIRTITAQLVRAIPKLKWRLRPWSRIVKWGKDFLGVKSYVGINEKEAKMIETAHELVRRWQKYAADLGGHKLFG